MRASSPFRLAACLIVIAASGCDNVQWGGAELAFVPPPPKEQEAGPADEEPGEDRLPEGPLLHLVHAQGGGIGTLVPIAEISGDSLRRLEADDWERYGNRLIAEHYRAGDELALFRAGARVGTFIIQSAEVPPESVCPRVPRVTGIMELGPGAGDATEFLALRKTDAPAPPQPAAAPQPTRAMQVLAPILAERLLRARSAPLPGNWQRAMAQLTPIPIAGSEEPGFAATFLVGDTLGPGLDDAGSSLFFVATPQAQSGYEPVFAEYNDYASTGKAAPRLVDYLDWDRDGQVELLLQYYGVADTWFAAVGRAGSQWRTIFQHRCPPSAAAPPAEQDSAQAGASSTRQASSQPTEPAPAGQQQTSPRPRQQPAPEPRQQAAPPAATRADTAPVPSGVGVRPDTTRRDTLPAQSRAAFGPDTTRLHPVAQPVQDTVTRRDTLRRDTIGEP